MEIQVEKKQDIGTNGQTHVANMELVVVHPLFDIPEQKVDIENAGPMHVTKATWFALWALRAYLIIMIVLAIYRFLGLAGIID